MVAQNTSDKPLYLYTCDLGPSWQIDSLICDNGGRDYKVVHPKKRNNDVTDDRPRVALEIGVNVNAKT